MKPQQLHGWAMFKDGNLHSCSLERTKRSLLIGYDMIPLRGLIETEKHLRSKGYEAKRAIARIAECAHFDAIVPAINGKLTPELLAWASWKPEIEGALYRAALYFSDRLPVTGDSNRATLNKFIFTPKRQEKRYKQRAMKVQAILESCGITFVPIVIQPVHRARP